MVQPFDAAGVRAAGEMFPVAEEVAQSQNVGFGAFSVASSGVLVDRAGAAASRELWWVDRTGKRLSSATKPAGINALYRLSPDEKIGAPRELFMNSSMTSYRVSRDGQRFLVNLPAGGESSSGIEPVTVVTNWQAGLSR